MRKEPQTDTPQSVIHRFILYPLNLDVYLNAVDLLIPDANRIGGDIRCKSVVPEFICGEDDPSLQKKRSKHPQKQTQAQRGKQTLEIHMFQTGI